jgi:hypothetical protein
VDIRSHNLALFSFSSARGGGFFALRDQIVIRLRKVKLSRTKLILAGSTGFAFLTERAGFWGSSGSAATFFQGRSFALSCSEKPAFRGDFLAAEFLGLKARNFFSGGVDFFAQILVMAFMKRSDCLKA